MISNANDFDNMTSDTKLGAQKLCTGTHQLSSKSEEFQKLGFHTR